MDVRFGIVGLALEPSRNDNLSGNVNVMPASWR
jgi:hypothetical protein